MAPDVKTACVMNDVSCIEHWFIDSLGGSYFGKENKHKNLEKHLFFCTLEESFCKDIHAAFSGQKQLKIAPKFPL